MMPPLPHVLALLLAASLHAPTAGERLARAQGSEIVAPTGAAVALRYRLAMPRPASHLFEVEIRVEGSPDADLTFRMPSWAPGRHVIDDFGWQVQDEEAVDEDGDPLPVIRSGKDSWTVGRRGRGTVVFRYRRYAHAQSPAFSSLDARHGTINGASLFAWVEGLRHVALTFEVSPPPGWRIATPLPGDADAGRFTAANYDALIDAPIEIGDHQVYGFECQGQPFGMVLAGAEVTEADGRRLLAVLPKVADAQGRIFGGFPFERYLFLFDFRGQGPLGAAGLGHRSSARIVVHGAPGDPEALRAAVTAASRALSQAWFGRSIAAAGIVGADLSREVDTGSLWITDGLAAYFGDLSLVRAGWTAPADYLEALRRKIDEDAAQGQATSLVDASRRAWQRRPPPEPSATFAAGIDVVRRGELAALVLDATIRGLTDGRRSLEDVARAFEERYGRSGEGFGPGDFERACAQAAGTALDAWFERHVRGREPLPLAEALARIGVELIEERRPEKPSLRCTTEGRPPQVRQIRTDSPLLDAGIQEGDVLVSLGGSDLATVGLDDALARVGAERPVAVAVRRGGDVLTVSLRPGRDAAIRRSVKLAPGPPEITARRAAWLEGRKP